MIANFLFICLSCIASLISIFSYFIQRDGITGTCSLLGGIKVSFSASSFNGVSWPSGLVHRTQILVLSENQNVGSILGSGTCVLEQDT